MAKREIWLVACLLLGYLALVQCLRLRRSRVLAHRFNMNTRRDFARMTADDAQSILKDLTELEFPKLMGFSIIFALFKTYGIPSVSSLLVATGQLSDSATASKRTADTGVLLLEFALNKPSSDRYAKSVARMNYLHSHHRRTGKITNSDLLYTLSLFALEPTRWINTYEWRQLTPLEFCATGTYWKTLGDAMEISFEPLPSHATGWKDGSHWLDELSHWSQSYEKTKMIPAETNKQLAQAHLQVLFLDLPSSLKRVGEQLVATLLGDRCREAMMLQKPSKAIVNLVHYGLLGRRLFLRHCCLPRPNFLRKDYIPATPNPTTGRYSAKEYLSYPWYVTPTFRNRWGLRAWVTRLLGRKIPGDDGNSYIPEGYLISEVGPVSQKARGTIQMNETEAKLARASIGGCPMGFLG